MQLIIFTGIERLFVCDPPFLIPSVSKKRNFVGSAIVRKTPIPHLCFSIAVYMLLNRTQSIPRQTLLNLLKQG
jgi:hypothetical protein